MSCFLPINEHIEDIVLSIKDNEVVMVNAATGSGKSVGIPLALINAGYKVHVSVPTRISAISLKNYTSTLTEKSVGYAAESNVNYEKNTNLVYATSGHYRRKLLGIFSRKEKSIDFADIFVLDECHMKTLDMSVIISIWMHAKNIGYKVPKLLLMSATPSNIEINPSPVIITVPVPTPFNVEIVYMETKPGEEKEKAEKIVFEHVNSGIEGDVLIFVAGSKDCDDIVYNLSEKLPTCEVMPVYSTLPESEISKIHKKSEKKKIIVSTSICETSVTIEGLSMVIDTMKIKNMVESTTESSQLAYCNITKSNAQQRAGRVGRTSDGTCIRLISEKDYDSLADDSLPEIKSVPLYNTIMEILNCNLDPEILIGCNKEKIVSSIQILEELGMIKDKKVTPMGNFSFNFPMDVRNVAFLWNWIQLGYPLYQGIVIASLIECHGNGYFYIPKPRRRNMDMYEIIDENNKYISHIFGKWIGKCSLETYINMWSSFVDDHFKIHYNIIDSPYRYNYYDWCYKKSVNYKVFLNLVNTISKCYKLVRYNFKNLKTEIRVFKFKSIDVIENVRTILSSTHSQKLYQSVSNGYAKNRFAVLHLFDSKREISLLEKDRIENGIYVLCSHEIMTRIGKPIGYIDIYVDFVPTKPQLS